MECGEGGCPRAGGVSGEFNGYTVADYTVSERIIPFVKERRCGKESFCLQIEREICLGQEYENGRSSCRTGTGRRLKAAENWGEDQDKLFDAVSGEQ